MEQSGQKGQLRLQQLESQVQTYRQENLEQVLVIEQISVEKDNLEGHVQSLEMQLVHVNK